MNFSRSSEQPKSTATEEVVEDQQDKKELFPIVGIGASAGGLEAFTQLLSHLPSDTGMGFVLIQHLDPHHKSLLTDILTKLTQMPVFEVNDGMSVEPDHVYIIPPNRKMTISQGVLRLTPRENTHGKHMPVDSLFYSLAQDREDKAIGVVLSGGDGDGALGLEAIKAANGITFAQCEKSAKFDSMPRNAALTGSVDFILPPKEIGEELARISRHPYVSNFTPAKSVELLPESEDNFDQIFTLLRSVTGVDFTNYKRPTLQRRLKRRLVLHKMDLLQDYIKYLQDNRTEVEALSEDFLIHVTYFFRDPEVFQALKNQVFSSIIQKKSPESPIRIWVPGCSTGEEVYSIAICLLEVLDALVTKPTIQIFGTDISEIAIDKARSGTYIQSLTNNISPERLRRFFVKVEGGYQISKPVREMCIFAKQNLIADPPFYNLDLISCRNVLIYLGLALQKKVIPVFHYSLKPTGFLLLGTSESTGKFSDLFDLVDKRYKIYSRKLAPHRVKFDFVKSNHLEKLNSDKQMKEDAEDTFDLQKEADRIVWNKYAPAGVIINSDMDILQFRGETSPYLEPAPGRPSFNLLKMAQAALRLELRTALRQAKRLDVPVRKEGIQVIGKDQLREISFEVIPFKAPPTDERYFLVLFEDVPPSAIPQSTVTNSSVSTGKGKQTGVEQEVTRLKQELAATKQELSATQEYLQSNIQEHEATTQALMTANEELLSSNEELQSTNEEVETAKEEIQATNEEINITNEELRSRIVESNQLNNDLRNLLTSVNIPIVIVGMDLSIRRFTPMAEKFFNLIPTDMGRPLSHINPNINVPNLEKLILEVIDTLIIKQLEIQDQEGHWYDLMIRPYKTMENQIDGAVLLLVDIHALKRSAEQIKESRDYAEAIVETVQQPLMVLDERLRVLRANQSFYQTFQVTPAQTEFQSIFELGNGQWNVPQLRSQLEEVLPQDIQFHNFEVEYVFEHIGPKTMLLNACKISRAGDVKMMLLAIEDITDRKLFEEQRNLVLTQEQSARKAAEVANRTKDEFLSIVSHELRNPLSSMLAWVQMLRNHKFDAAKTARALEMIERSAKSQTKLIEDLLDISRITTGKLELNASLIDLAPVIEAAISVAHVSADAKNIQIESVLKPETVRITGDPDRLQQVIWNLLSNAIKFTPVGGRVTVTLKHVDSLAQIQVSDTGQGISADFLPYVFDRFRQANGSSTRAHGGLGLGLSIVRNLVELHGGTVHVESPGEGQGTTITVRLPLRAAAASTPTEGSLSSAGEPVSTVGLGVPLDDSIPTLAGLRVLVVDDEAGLLELLTTILEYYGANVTAFASAQEAIAALRANPEGYDVLLSDIGMPDEDGYALIRQVRALGTESGGQIPAAALTAYASAEEQSKSLAAGFQRHISKPVEPAQLASIIADLAAQEGVRGEG